jgi:hypothetical protein
MTRWERLRYWIADRVFELEMDEAFRMGIREGYDVVFREVEKALELKLAETPKTKQPGVLLALEVVKEMH